MIARVYKYSFAQAKTKALKGRFLSPEDWRFLMRMKNLQDVLKYLSGTDYARALSHLPPSRLDPSTVSLVLYDEIFEDYGKLLKAVPRAGTHILRSLLVRYEAENLKTILRGIWHGRPAAEIRWLLYHMGRLSRLPVAQLLQVRQVVAVIELLQSSVFYLPLRHALPQFNAQGRLFPLEMAVDITVFENIARAARSLRGFDRRTAESLVGELVDCFNLCWLVRFRHVYALSPEESINYTLHGGGLLSTAKLGVIARSRDLPEFLSNLPGTYAAALAAAEAWQDVEILLERWFVKQLHKAFYSDPFQVGLQIAYVLLKEIEVKSLERLISAVAIGEPQEIALRFASLPLRGSGRVQV